MDNLVITPRERPYSPDIMDMQSMISRVISDLMQFEHAAAFNTGSLALSSANVCYGLAVSGSYGTGATFVTMSPGVLGQYSSTLSPLPGTLDSKYRVGFNRNSLTINLPNPGVATWYLLEAQVQEVASYTELRDVMNTVTGQFVATNVVKRKEWTIKADATTWLAGTSTQIPTPTFGDWVPICAALVQPGGTISVIADLIDMRPVAAARVPTRQGWSRSAKVPVLRTVATPINTAPTWNIRLAVESAVTNQDTDTGYGGGLLLSCNDANATLNSFDPHGAAVIEPGLVTTAEDWFYLYLCPWYDVGPVHSRQGVSYARGVLVLSDKVPDTEGLFNGSALTLPAPFGNYAVPAYQAPCVGAVYTNAANNGLSPISGGNGEYAVLMAGYLASITSTGTLSTSRIPKHAKTLKWTVAPTVTGSGVGGFAAVEIGPTGMAGGESWNRATWNLDALPTELDEKILHVPRINGEDIAVSDGGGYNVTGVNINLIGYTT